MAGDMASPPPSLDCLPPEVHHKILTHLEDDDLRALGLVNKCLCLLSKQYWGWTIRIRISNVQKLCEDVATWSHRLTVSGPERVSRLVISGGNRRDPAGGENVALEALSEFVQKLRWLSQLTIDCEDYLGVSDLRRCLQKLLQNIPSQCKVDYKFFRFENGSTARISADDYAFLTSPNLYAVGASAGQFTWNKERKMELNYTPEALLDATRFNPNIKSVSLEWGGIAGDIEQIEGLSKSWPPWQGFIFPEGIAPPKPADRGAPLELKVGGQAYNFGVYNQLIDFSRLQKLELSNGCASELCCNVLKLDPERQEATSGVGSDTYPRDMTPNLSFSSLKELVLYMYCRRSGLEFVQTDPTEPYNNFLLHLPPLWKLSISGFSDPSIFDTIVSHHGSALRQLSIFPRQLEVNIILTLPEVIRLQSMPFLTHLTIPVRRSKGSAAEVAIYRALGQLPKVQEMTLILDYSNLDLLPYDPVIEDFGEAPNDPSFSEWEQQFWHSVRHDPCSPRIGHYKDSLISGAIDETLAISIFNCISSAKTAKTLFPLERLKLFSVGSKIFGMAGESINDFDDVFTVISQWWHIERGRRDDQRDVLFTRLIREDEFLPDFVASQWEFGFRVMNRTEKDMPLSPQAEAVFSHVWPDWQSRNTDWRQAWHSFPLDEEGSLEDGQAV